MKGCFASEFLVNAKPVFRFLPKQQLKPKRLVPSILNRKYILSAPLSGTGLYVVLFNGGWFSNGIVGRQRLMQNQGQKSKWYGGSLSCPFTFT